MLCRRIASSCNRCALYLYSGVNILSSCFLLLVQYAPALPICRAFVATATVLPGVNPLEPDVPLQSHAVAPVLLFLPRRLIACHGHNRSRFTLLLALCLHYSQVCRVKNDAWGNRTRRSKTPSVQNERTAAIATDSNGRASKARRLSNQVPGTRVTHPKPTRHQRIALRYIGHCRRQHPSLASPGPTFLG